MPAGARVDRRARRDRVARDHRAHRLRRARCAALERAPRAAQHRPDRTHDLGRLGDALAQRVEQELRRARRGFRDPTRGRPARRTRGSCRAAASRRRRPTRRRSARGASSAGARRCRPRDPRPTRSPTAGARGRAGLPARASSSATSCSHDPGPRQRGVPHVVRDVEAVVVDPDRPALLVRHRHEPAPEPRHQRQPRQHEVAHFLDPEPPVGVEERCALENAHRADVHRVLGPLQVQEARVERGEAVVLAHLRPIVGRTLATVYGVDLVPTAVWTHLARAGARARRASRAARRQLRERFADVARRRRGRRRRRRHAR